MTRLVLALAAAALIVPAAGAPMQPAPFQGKGKIVFSCSGCPQQPSGPSLYLVNADGSGFRRLVTPKLSPYGPRWSPNGRRISLSSRFTEIWTIDPAGRSARRLTHACRECDYPPAAWSPDGRRLAFPRESRIFTMNADGTRERRLVGRGRPGFGEPDWSPDGKRIAFDQNGDRLWVVHSNGRLPRKLSRVSGRYPRWSPSGKWIAFIGFTGNGAALMVVRADGTHPRILYKQENLEINSTPAWSPDGRHIAFAIRHEFRQDRMRYDGHEFMVATLDGSPPRPIVIPELPVNAYSELYGLDWR
jgi:Tol biopolymer transport system component